MRKMINVLFCLLLLSGCSEAKTRTEVIDILKDSYYLKNDEGQYYYETSDEHIEIGYHATYVGYTETLFTTFGEGPVVSISALNSKEFYNYQINDKTMYYSNTCMGQDESGKEVETKTEISYSFKRKEIIVGMDGCPYNTNEDEFVATLKEKKEEAEKIMSDLNLTAKDLNKLKSE